MNYLLQCDTSYSYLFLSGGYCVEDEYLSAKTIKKKSHRYRTCGILYLCEFKLPDFGKSSTVSNEFVTDPHVLVNNVSFSHIREIMVLNDAFERFFYETECMKCNWNVRELRRQIKTNLYVRAGISKKPELLLKKSVDNANGTMLSIKDPFTFEFLGLDARDAVSGSYGSFAGVYVRTWRGILF